MNVRETRVVLNNFCPYLYDKLYDVLSRKQVIKREHGNASMLADVVNKIKCDFLELPEMSENTTDRLRRFRHGDEVVVLLNNVATEARIELRFDGPSHSGKDESLYVCKAGRVPWKLTDCPGEIIKRVK